MHGFFSMGLMKKHPSLIPLVICVGAGAVGSVLYLGRLAFKNPEVCWNKRGDQEPWNEYTNKQYKFISLDDTIKSVTPPPKF